MITVPRVSTREPRPKLKGFAPSAEVDSDDPLMSERAQITRMSTTVQNPPPLQALRHEVREEEARRSAPLSKRLDRAAIRVMDIVVGLGLVVVLSPVILLTLIVIKIDSRGPGFYRANRVGYEGSELRMLKFRKMGRDATGPKLTSGDDARLTRVGVWLTRLKLDEIPQLWHVLKGEMSLVGPRPEDPEFVEMMRAEYRTILRVKPGVTGYSQIAFAEESNILDPEDPLSHYIVRLFPQKLALDKMYASERSLTLNLRILFWTAAAVVMRRAVAVHRDTGKMNLRSR
jgi:lipopolysaccharide/colanic/teichoic acid biosynthesis glycosyltransferase